MHSLSSPPRRVIAGLLVASALALVLAPSARGSAACDAQEVERPFLPWADPAAYVLVRNGTLEHSAAWNLTRGATRVGGNEVFHVHDPADRSSLALPQGSSARTAPMCVGVEHPTLRLFVRNSGAADSLLLVEVLFKDALGASHAVPIGAVAGAPSWQPTLPLAIGANLFAALAGEHVDVAFRFTPQGDGDWSIDDVYVDPFRHG